MMAQDEEEVAEDLVVIALSKLKDLCQCGGDQELLISTKLMELAEKNQDDPIFHNDEKLIEWAWPKLVQISDGTPSSSNCSIHKPPFAHLKGCFVKYLSDW